jgi:hypothetical protein
MSSPANLPPSDPWFDEEFPASQSVTSPALEVFVKPDPLVALSYWIAKQRLSFASGNNPLAGTGQPTGSLGGEIPDPKKTDEEPTPTTSPDRSPDESAESAEGEL